MRLQPWHLVVLIAVIVLLFGANKLPTLARSVGQSLKIFKSEVQDLTGDGRPAETAADSATGTAAGAAVEGVAGDGAGTTRA